LLSSSSSSSSFSSFSLSYSANALITSSQPGKPEQKRSVRRERGELVGAARRKNIFFFPADGR
jgi:hypothetical protein